MRGGAERPHLSAARRETWEARVRAERVCVGSRAAAQRAPWVKVLVCVCSRFERFHSRLPPLQVYAAAFCAGAGWLRRDAGGDKPL